MITYYIYEYLTSKGLGVCSFILKNIFCLALVMAMMAFTEKKYSEINSFNQICTQLFGVFFMHTKPIIKKNIK